MIRRILPLILLTLLIGYSGCSSSNVDADDVQFDIVAAIFSNTVTEFKIHVFYETGAAPYTGNIGATSNQVWDVTKESFEALFQGHPSRTVTVPTVIGQMTSMPDQARATWNATQLLALTESFPVTFRSGAQINIPVYFVQGTYNGDSNILGVHFTGYPYAFIFKDIVAGTGGPVVQRYAEQATVIHELGHVVGLVGNGLPMAANHQDSAHSHHTTNANCVMYWQVESKNAIATVLAAIIAGNQLNLFGSEALADAAAYHP